MERWFINRNYYLYSYLPFLFFRWAKSTAITRLRVWKILKWTDLKNVCQITNEEYHIDKTNINKNGGCEKSWKIGETKKNICFFAITLNYSKQTQLIIDTAWINRVEVLKTRNKEGKNKIELGNIVNDK